MIIKKDEAMEKIEDYEINDPHFDPILPKINSN
jgi:hypothetical protein